VTDLCDLCIQVVVTQGKVQDVAVASSSTRSAVSINSVSN